MEVAFQPDIDQERGVMGVVDMFRQDLPYHLNLSDLLVLPDVMKRTDTYYELLRSQGSYMFYNTLLIINAVLALL